MIAIFYLLLMAIGAAYTHKQLGHNDPLGIFVGIIIFFFGFEQFEQWVRDKKHGD